MRELRFYKMSPGGNSTILVLDAVAKELRAEYARTLMSEHHLQAEQVGYLDLTACPVRLDMMGGEFCGNACRAAAAVMVREGTGLTERDGELHGLISVSGVEHPLALRVVNGKNELVCWVEMPLAQADTQVRADDVAERAPGVSVVCLPGITHLCLDESVHPFPADYTGRAAQLRRDHNLDAAAVGCVWYRTGSLCRIKPVVWVRATDSTYYETGCGSGSLAVALCQSRGKNLPLDLRIVQPSGSEIGVQLLLRDSRLAAWIYGPVALVARGETYV